MGEIIISESKIVALKLISLFQPHPLIFRSNMLISAALFVIMWFVLKKINQKILYWKSVKQRSKEANIVPVRWAPPHWCSLRQPTPAFQWGGRANTVGNLKVELTATASPLAVRMKSCGWFYVCTGTSLCTRDKAGVVKYHQFFPEVNLKCITLFIVVAAQACVRVWIL